MTLFSSISKRHGATLAGVFSLALSCVLLLCGAGTVPVENFQPQGAMQGDLNAGGHNLTNAATVSATNVVVSGSLTAPAGFTLSFSNLTSLPTTLAGYGITDPVALTSGSYANPSWLTSLAYSKLSGAPSLAMVATSGAYTDLTGLPTLGPLSSIAPSGTPSSTTFLKYDGSTYSWAVPPGATYLAGTGLTLAGTTFSVNTSQNIATLSNLTGNGLVKTSGGTGALSIDTNTYLTATGNGSGLTGLAFSQIGGTPTTVAGYGITDGVTLTGTQTLTNKSIAASEVNSGTLAFAQIPTGTSSSTVAIGNDTRFPASVTGIRIGAGAGSADAALTIGSGLSLTSGTLVATASGGTVTSVGLTSAGVVYNVTGSPVTGSGTLALNLINQNANTVFAGPASGGAAAPSFRSITAADVPTLNQNTTGSAASFTGSLAGDVTGMQGATSVSKITGATAGSTTSQASLQALGAEGSSVVAKSASFSVVQADAGKMFNVTTGTSAVVAMLPSASTLPSGWTIYVRKADSAAGSVANDAATFLITSGGHTEKITSDGTNFIYRAFYGAFDGSGNFTLTNGGNGNITLTAAGTGRVKVPANAPYMSGVGMPTGPANINFFVCGDSRNAGTVGTTGLGGNRNMEGVQGNTPSKLQNMGFLYNAFVVNSAISSTGIMHDVFGYNNGGVTLTGTVTANSLTLAFASTTGVAVGQSVAGPGLPIGMSVASLVANTSVTLTDPSGQGRKPFATPASSAYNFAFPMVGSSAQIPGYPIIPTGHQASPAVNTNVYTCTVTSGSNQITLNSGTWALAVGSTITSTHFSGTTTVLACNTTYATVSTNATGSSSTEAVTVVPYGIFYIDHLLNDTETETFTSNTTSSSTLVCATPTIVPVIGYGITSSNLPGGTTITNITLSTPAAGGLGSTMTVTLSASTTTTASNVVFTVTPSASSIFTQLQGLISQAQADGWEDIVICTPFKGWTGSWLSNDSVRLALDSSIIATYQTATVAGVKVCDIASMAMFNTNDPSIYADSLHLTPYGHSQKAEFVDNFLRTAYAARMTGQPVYTTQAANIPQEWVPTPTVNPTLAALPGSAQALALTSSAGNTTTIVATSTGSGGSTITEKFTANTGVSFSNAIGGNASIGIPTTAGTTDVFASPRTFASVNGSTSGTAAFLQTLITVGRKEVLINCNALVGTASFTFTTPFTNTPVVMSTSGPATSVVTSLSTTAVTVTGATTTGPLFIEGN
jgi:hypothetical protein